MRVNEGNQSLSSVEGDFSAPSAKAPWRLECRPFSGSDLLPLNSPGRGGLSLRKIGLVAYSLNFPLSRNRVADYKPLYSSLVNPGAFWTPKMLLIEGLWN
jgi:hypothetical protein